MGQKPKHESWKQGSTLHDLGVGKDFLNKIPFVQELTGRIL